MSHTVRRRRTHTRHQRGWGTKAPTSRERHRPVRSTAPKGKFEVPVVTDHAIVCWLERVMGMDVRATVEAEILADGRDERIDQVQNGRIRIGGSRTTIVLREGFVVGVVIEDARG